MLLRLNVNGSDQAAVLTGREIGPGANMRVIEAETRGLWHKRNSAVAVRRNERRAPFRRSIHIGRNELPVPVQLLWSVGLVAKVDADSFTLFQAQQRAGEFSVIRGDREDATRSEFDRLGGDR